MAYNQTLSAFGGKSPYSWALESVKLPVGLVLNSSGVISGAPTGIDTATFTTSVTDGDGATDSKTFTITVNEPPPLSISTATLSTGLISSSYEQTIVAAGGSGKYLWSMASRTLI